MSGVIRVWVNDRLYDAHEPSIAAVDRGFTVGDAVFETCKIDRGQVFAPTRHRRRLERSAAGLGLIGIDHERLDQGSAAVLGAGDPIEFGRLRYWVTGGEGPLGSDRDGTSLTHIVTASTQRRPQGSAKISVVPWTRNERSATAGLKTTSYAENVVALAYAKERGALEAVFANTRGDLCECTGSNIFVVVDGEIVTPSLASGCLAGVTRELTIEWCREAGMTVREEELPMDILLTCDEAFLTSTTKDVLAIDRIDDRVLPVPGAVTRRASEIFVARAAQGMDP